MLCIVLLQYNMRYLSQSHKLEKYHAIVSAHKMEVNRERARARARARFNLERAPFLLLP